MAEIILESTIECPQCGHRKAETMFEAPSPSRARTSCRPRRHPPGANHLEPLSGTLKVDGNADAHDCIPVLGATRTGCSRRALWGTLRCALAERVSPSRRGLPALPPDVAGPVAAD